VLKVPTKMHILLAAAQEKVPLKLPRVPIGAQCRRGFLVMCSI
jgi:hypothetical protein